MGGEEPHAEEPQAAFRTRGVGSLESNNNKNVLQACSCQGMSSANLPPVKPVDELVALLPESL